MIKDLYFNDASIDIQGNHGVTRCQFRQINKYAVQVFNALDTRVDHCDFSDYQSATAVAKGCVEIDNASVGNNTLKRLLIDYCHIHAIRQDVNVPTPPTSSSWAAAPSTNRNPEVIVDHCLIEDVGRIGSGEVIVCKVSGIKIRYCTFLDLANRGNSPVTGGAYPAQYVQQRQGQGLEVRSCWFENMTAGALKMFDDTRITGLGNLTCLAIGNHFVGNLDLWLGAGNGAAAASRTITPQSPGG